MASPQQRRKRRKRRKRALGVPPGTLSVDAAAPPSELWVFAYGPEQFHEQRGVPVDQIAALRGTCPVLWLNVDGVGDATTLRRIGEIFHLHPLALEDVASVHQRPKAEEYGDHEFIVLRTLDPEPALEAEQISVFLGSDYLITFQERAGDSFDGIRDRIRRAEGRIRGAGADYLAYAAIDSILDHYFPILDAVADRLEAIEEQILAGQIGGDAVFRVYEVLQDLRRIRQAVLPLREVLAEMWREPSPHIREDTRVYLRDAYDHTRQLFDQLDANRETAVTLMDLHLSRANQRLNEVMKVLTIISTIFIPLSFIAGVYGMNFVPDSSPYNMPETHWRYGYPAAIALMVGVSLGLLVWFRRRGWIGEQRARLRAERSDGPDRSS